jgi:hypothetical protein
MYRPQFPYVTPSGCQDQRCVYSFDSTNTPFLAMTIPSGATFSRIPLPLDKDADFYLRGIVTTDNGAGLQIRLEDMKSHALSDYDNPLPTSGATNYEFPALYSATDGAGIVALDSDDYGVYCQQGSRLYLFVHNDGSNPIDLTALVVNLHGVKRYNGNVCAA